MASTVAEAPLAQLTAVPANAGNANLVGALKSEFTKIRSVRSTYWNLLGMMVVTIGFGALASYGATRNPHGPGFDPTMHSLGGLYISQLIIAALGVIVITSEYSTKMIGTSLTAMPRRGTFVAAKAIVFGAVALVTSLVTCFAAFFIGQAIMSSHHINATLSQPGVLRAVVGGALFLTAVGLLGFGIGLLIRHSAGAICAAVALLFVASILVNLLPMNWQNDLDLWLPAIAGGSVWSVVPQSSPPATFGPWTGFAVLCGWAVLAIAGGMYLFRKRNA
jgi:ABC-type transport system involved in multi-copper enzyme maturation permease subunit